MLGIWHLVGLWLILVYFSTLSLPRGIEERVILRKEMFMQMKKPNWKQAIFGSQRCGGSGFENTDQFSQSGYNVWGDKTG